MRAKRKTTGGKVGHPCRLTPEVKERILVSLRAGNYQETAAAYAGIARDTLNLWMRKGRKGEQPYADFVHELDEALAQAEVRDLATIERASTDQWQAAAWRLERRYPERWGRRDRLHAELQHSGEVKVDASDGLLDMFRRLAGDEE